MTGLFSRDSSAGHYSASVVALMTKYLLSLVATSLQFKHLGPDYAKPALLSGLRARKEEK